MVPLRRPQASPWSPLTSVQNVVAVWKEHTPSVAKPTGKSTAQGARPLLLATVTGSLASEDEQKESARDHGNLVLRMHLRELRIHHST
jgi:hypothetical protein